LPENLNIETAKARLKALEPDLEIGPWVRQRPFSSLVIAAVAGGVAARVPRGMLLTCLDLLIQVVLPEDEANDHKAT